MQKSIEQKNCYGCGGRMEIGFLWTREPIRFMPKERVIPKINSNTDCDIFKNPWWQKFLPSPVRRVAGYRCSTCKILIIEYGKEYVGNESRELAEKLLAQERGGPLI